MTIVPLPYLIHQIESQVSHDWIGLLFFLPLFVLLRWQRSAAAATTLPPSLDYAPLPLASPVLHLFVSLGVSQPVALIVIVVLCRITCPKETNLFARELKERS